MFIYMSMPTQMLIYVNAKKNTITIKYDTKNTF